MIETSIIITTFNNKPIYTLKNNFPSNSEILINKLEGLAFSRNYYADKANGKKLAFFDDDIIVKNPKIWDFLGQLKPNNLIMVRDASTRIMFIHKNDFNRVGKFDNYYSISGEDREFCLRCIKKGVQVKFILHNMYKHVYHPIRSRRKKLAIKQMRQHAHMYASYGYLFDSIDGLGFKRMFATFTINPWYKLSYLFWDVVRSIFMVKQILTFHR